MIDVGLVEMRRNSAIASLTLAMGGGTASKLDDAVMRRQAEVEAPVAAAAAASAFP